MYIKMLYKSGDDTEIKCQNSIKRKILKRLHESRHFVEICCFEISNLCFPWGFSKREAFQNATLSLILVVLVLES